MVSVQSLAIRIRKMKKIKIKTISCCVCQWLQSREKNHVFQSENDWLSLGIYIYGYIKKKQIVQISKLLVCRMNFSMQNQRNKLRHATKIVQIKIIFHILIFIHFSEYCNLTRHWFGIVPVSVVSFGWCGTRLKPISWMMLSQF